MNWWVGGGGGEEWGWLESDWKFCEKQLWMCLMVVK